MHKYAIGVVGASGYSGIELCRILAAHPGVEVRFVASDRWEGATVRARTGIGGAVGALAYVPNGQALKASQECTAVLLATPAEASLELAPALLERGIKVVDLSGAFRLADPAAYPRHYGFEHRAPALLERAVYGLPELVDREAIAAARVVANPGCYPTAAALALVPLLRAGLLADESIVIDASSGVSGAGRQATEAYSFCEVADDVRPYKVLRHQHAPEIAQSLARGAGKPVRFTFTPHLLPIKRGILSTASARLAPGIAAGAPAEALRAAYRDEPLVEVLDTPEQVSIARTVGTARAAVAVSTSDSGFDPGRVVVVSSIDNLLKGAASQAIQNLNLMLGLPERTALEPAPRGLSVNVRGFRFAGLHAGIKPARKDLALVVSDVPAAAAGCFTINRAQAAPVQDAAPRLPATGIRAILINSGNANALTGEQGRKDVVQVRRALGAALRVGPESIFTASTGVIGVPLPVEKITQGLPRLVESLSASCEPAAEAIMTTDTHPKVARRSLHLGGREVSILGMAKGSGMIAPQMATMIAVVCTDAAVPPPVLARALRSAVDASFHAVVVDGDMSTNDCVFALANGMAANAPVGEAGPDYESFCAALTDVCAELARDIAADGEGATKLLTVEITQAPSAAIARDISKAIAVSPLVKTALFGADPNWGRVLATVGARAGSQEYPIDPEKSEVRIQGIRVFGDGVPQLHDPERLRARMREPEVVVEVALAAGKDSATAWGCDFSYDYVKINADYTSLIVPQPDGSVRREDRLTRYSPGFKQTLLVEALKYISRFSGTTCVLAYGGEGLKKSSLRASFCEDVVLLRSVGLRPVVVHGAVPPEEGMPRVDPDVLEMVLTGRITGDLVALLNAGGGRAVGVSGKDGPLLRAVPAPFDAASAMERMGEVREVNRGFLEMLMEKDYLPVIAPVGIGPGGETLHLSVEGAAAEVAIALGAPKLILLQDAKGLLADGEVRNQLTVTDLEHQLADGAVPSQNKTLVHAILRALAGGVQRVHVLDGRVPHATIAELFTDHGVGTLVTAE